MALTGNGNAPKFQVGKMMRLLLNLPEKSLGLDEGDALAVAYCHLLTKKKN
jgi:Holliday junction resolvasome RuvABC endonuclease subunit